ncbi:MAG: transglutaminase domain-containing protein [Myxococcales bacterium]|nr:MAG: transglutaminase domain-containing protein [Myxococcales bacterium]
MVHFQLFDASECRHGSSAWRCHCALVVEKARASCCSRADFCSAFLLGLFVRSWILSSLSFVSFLDTTSRFAFAQDLGFFICCYSVALMARSLALRFRYFVLLEIALVCVSFTQLLAAHRYGSINRPFELADPLLTQGKDPALAILLIGVAVSLLAFFVINRAKGLWRALSMGLFFLLILGVVVAGTQVLGLPTPSVAGDALGLRGKNKQQGQQKKNKEQSGKGQHSTEEMEFRDNYNDEADRSPVAVVLFHDDYSPPQGVYYFRQNAFSQYNGRRLVTTTRDDVDTDIAPGFPTTSFAIPHDFVVAGVRKDLKTTMALLADHSRPPGLESPISLTATENSNPSRFLRSYEVESAALDTEYLALIGAEAGKKEWTASEWKYYLAAPKDPRYDKLAQSIVDEMPEALKSDPMAKSVAVVSWLGSHGTYSLRHGYANAEDPTAAFLFGEKIGYCIHFAHAAVYLLRQLGIPSRVATGYAINEAARQGGSALLLSSADSHAWPEVYFQDLGWIVMDIFPEQSLDSPPPPPDPDLQRLLGSCCAESVLCKWARILRQPKPVAF